MNTFSQEISYQTPEMTPEGIKPITVTKTATFKELNRFDKDQRDLCWLIIEVFKKKEAEEVKIDKEVISKITNKFIDEMLVVDDVFTSRNKQEFINDNGAVINFGLWLAHNKILPFFLILMND